MMALTRSQIMSRIRSKNTKPELLVRKRLRKLGFEQAGLEDPTRYIAVK
ncbi:hypothetical protein LCGC14_1720150 [marine sediment metagenome]|uniref:Uncharacterized protein n=1 Tax=marine sediment metagenome TaxID=412755 RepID=A0A0F9HCZ0_9ZZZZ